RKDSPPPGRASATAESVNTTTAHDNATRAAICGQRGTSCSLRRNSRALAAAQREATAFGSGNLIAQFVLVVGLSRQHLRKWLCERQHAVEECILVEVADRLLHGSQRLGVTFTHHLHGYARVGQEDYFAFEQRDQHE